MRASQRFYPLVMNYIIRYDMRYHGSSLLNKATGSNLKGVVKKMLRMGGDVNTQSGFRPLGTCELPTPLIVAVGHERMVRLLLSTGAKQAVGGKRTSLLIAIMKRNPNEGIALLLSQNVDATDDIATPLSPTNILLLACKAQLATLVRHLLEQCTLRAKQVNVRIISIALYELLRSTASKGDFRLRELLEDVYQITLMLLQHGADPGMVFPGVRGACTARGVVLKYPDPRVRNVLLGAARTVDKPWRESSVTKAHRKKTQEAPVVKKLADDADGSVIAVSLRHATQYATLAAYLDVKETSMCASTPEDEIVDNASHSLNLTQKVARETQGLVPRPNMLTEAHPTTALYPQLAAPRPTIQPIDHIFWTQVSARAKSVWRERTEGEVGVRKACQMKVLNAPENPLRFGRPMHESCSV